MIQRDNQRRRGGRSGCYSDSRKWYQPSSPEKPVLNLGCGELAWQIGCSRSHFPVPTASLTRLRVLDNGLPGLSDFVLHVLLASKGSPRLAPLMLVSTKGGSGSRFSHAVSCVFAVVPWGFLLCPDDDPTPSSRAPNYFTISK